MTKFFNEILDTTQTDKRTPKYYKAVDWNIVNAIDKATWEKLTSQFWTDTRVPVSNDLKDWRLLSDLEKEVFNHAFAGLTMLDTLQSEEGAYKLKKAAKSQHEEAVYNNLLFMESMHAKSYSTIFQTLSTPQEIAEIFEWADHNDLLQEKAKMINEVYQNGNELEIKVASVFLESALFYSGFYTPLLFLGNGKMVNSAEIIKLILKDESVNIVPM